MKHPVVLEDGHTYERAAIEKWLSKRQTSPMTGLEVKSHNLISNTFVLQLLSQLEENGTIDPVYKQ